MNKSKVAKPPEQVNRLNEDFFNNEFDFFLTICSVELSAAVHQRLNGYYIIPFDDGVPGQPSTFAKHLVTFGRGVTWPSGETWPSCPGTKPHE